MGFFDSRPKPKGLAIVVNQVENKLRPRPMDKTVRVAIAGAVGVILASLLVYAATHWGPQETEVEDAFAATEDQRKNPDDYVLKLHFEIRHVDNGKDYDRYITTTFVSEPVFGFSKEPKCKLDPAFRGCEADGWLHVTGAPYLDCNTHPTYLSHSFKVKYPNHQETKVHHVQTCSAESQERVYKFDLYFPFSDWGAYEFEFSLMSGENVSCTSAWRWYCWEFRPTTTTETGKAELDSSDSWWNF